MNKISSFATSSVGRKISMGLTGFFLLSFLVVHLYLNLFLLKGDRGSTFNTYAEFMATYPSYDRWRSSFSRASSSMRSSGDGSGSPTGSPARSGTR